MLAWEEEIDDAAAGKHSNQHSRGVLGYNHDAVYTTVSASWTDATMHVGADSSVTSVQGQKIMPKNGSFSTTVQYDRLDQNI